MNLFLYNRAMEWESFYDGHAPAGFYKLKLKDCSLKAKHEREILKRIRMITLKRQKNFCLTKLNAASRDLSLIRQLIVF